MELDITELMKEENYTQEHYPIVGSVAQFGENAAHVTWENAQRCAKDTPILTDTAEIILAKEYFKSMGFSEDMAHWDNEKVNALVLQHILLEKDEYLSNPENSSIFESDGRYYIYIGY